MIRKIIRVYVRNFDVNGCYVEYKQVGKRFRVWLSSKDELGAYQRFHTPDAPVTEGEQIGLKVPIGATLRELFEYIEKNHPPL